MGKDVVPAAQWDVNQLKPFSIWIPLRKTEAGMFEWEWNGKWTSVVTIEAIYSNYSLSASLAKAEAFLPLRPVELEADLSKGKWGACSLCPLKEVCDYSDRNDVKLVKDWEELVLNYYEGPEE